MNQQQIREQAYYLWEKAGKPENRALDFWIIAEGLLSIPELVRSSVESISVDSSGRFNATIVMTPPIDFIEVDLIV